MTAPALGDLRRDLDRGEVRHPGVCDRPRELPADIERLAVGCEDLVLSLAQEGDDRRQNRRFAALVRDPQPDREVTVAELERRLLAGIARLPRSWPYGPLHDPGPFDELSGAVPLGLDQLDAAVPEHVVEGLEREAVPGEADLEAPVHDIDDADRPLAVVMILQN